MDRSPLKNNWIREGMAVASRHWPKIKMIVDKIERKTVEGETIPVQGVPGMSEVTKKHVTGVHTHWIADDGTYQNGIFHTIELQEWIDT